MKVLPSVIFFAVLAAVLTDCNAYLSEAALKKTTQMLKNVCLKKHPVEEEVLTNAKKGEFPEDNNNLKCFYACNFKTMQLVNSKGSIEKKPFKDKMTMLAPPSMMEVLAPAIEECTDKDKGELCQTAYDFIKCAYGINPKCLLVRQIEGDVLSSSCTQN